MGTEFLRKIILEELRKVLKEDTASEMKLMTTKGYNNLTPQQQQSAKEYMDRGMSPQDAIRQAYLSKMTSRGGDVSTAPTPMVASSSTKKVQALDGSVSPTQVANLGTPEQRKSSVLKLQSKLAQVGFLDKKDVIGIFGPKTTAAINSYLGGSGAGALTVGDIKKMPVSDIDTMLAALNAGNKQDIQKLVAKYRAGTATDAATKALAAANARDQARQSAQPAEPTTKPSSTGVTAPVQKPTVGTKSFGARKAEDVKDLGKKKEEEAPSPKLGGLEESIAREVKKLLKNI